MKKIICSLLFVYMFLVGIGALLDFILVVSGCTVPALDKSGAYMGWQNSPIVHYNVSSSANILMFMIGLMGIAGASVLFFNVLIVDSKKDYRAKPQVSKKVDKWLKEQLN